MSGWIGCCCWTTDGWKSGSNRKVDVDGKGKTNKVGEIKNKSRREEINFYFFSTTQTWKWVIKNVYEEFGGSFTQSEQPLAFLPPTSTNEMNMMGGRVEGWKGMKWELESCRKASRRQHDISTICCKFHFLSLRSPLTLVSLVSMMVRVDNSKGLFNFLFFSNFFHLSTPHTTSSALFQLCVV